MIEQALKLAEDMDGQAEIGFEIVMTAEERGSTTSSPSMQFMLKCAKDNQANAQLIRDLVTEIQKQTKPLSVEEIEGAFYKKCWYYDKDEKFDYYGFAREIEERHGIK